MSADVTPGRAVPVRARHISEWHEGVGDALWWTNPVTEPPYVGSPLDCGLTVSVSGGNQEFFGSVGGWPGYHEWWTPLPEVPEIPAFANAAARPDA